MVFALTFAATVAAMLAWRVVRSRRLIAAPPSLATAVVLASRVARVTGLGAGVGYLPASSVSYMGGWLVYFFAPLLLFFVCPLVSAWVDRSWRRPGDHCRRTISLIQMGANGDVQPGEVG